MKKIFKDYKLKNIPLLIAIIAVILSGLQIYNSNKISKADFGFKFLNNFNKKETKDLELMFDNDLLNYRTACIDSDSIAYFEFDYKKYHAYPDTLILQLKPKRIYSAYEIDNYLLMQYEDIGYYETHNLIDIDFIYSHFGYYLITTYENKNIKRYIKFIKSDKENGNSEYCKYYDHIYNKLVKR
ncbi:MAG: hypothetical protein Q8904_09305 [Bacteroidota bacterium]|nr:hypothetical protein [Bacteroidota bacterium]